jgi:4-hydroxybenzoyl-CoA thioesterase
MLESRAMFDVKLQTYWGDSDAVGIVFFPNYFKFVAQAEEEFYRAAGIIKDSLMDKHQIWLPRVEVFAKFTFPIRNGAAIRVR